MQSKAWYGVIATLLLLQCGSATAAGLRLSDQDTFETQGLSVIVHQNTFHPVFRDEKIAGIQIILHGDRIATDGEVRLQPTPEQWDPVPMYTERKRGPAPDQLIVSSGYPELPLTYRLEITAEDQGFRVAVHLDRPLPDALVGKAGFNLDFLPTSYFGKSYMIGSTFGMFPRYPNGSMKTGADGLVEPLPLASGNAIVLSPEDPLTRVAITSDGAPLMLYDARNKAQNGWFVVRSLLPAGRTTNALVWHVRPHVIPGWIRKPVVSFNQVGYTPERDKTAIIELDPLYRAPKVARLMRLGADGRYQEAYRGEIKPWGKWLRYNYASFDFSRVRQPGIYAIAFGGQTFNPFRIDSNLYSKGVWQPSLDTYLPVQMDHVKVREGYRIWHGASHLDDARQAPPNHQHFDGYWMGPNTDSPFAAGEHIPGLNVGGWYDAGDFDIRTQTQSQVVRNLVMAREVFHIDWDETTVDEEARSVQIRQPDGIPDDLQQVKHGVLALMAQYKAFGHAIGGIIEPTLQQYTHLGDGASKTDGKIYSAAMGPLQSDGIHSGVPDDRWAFTMHATPLNYDAAAGLAAASRVLRGYDDALAEECLQTALRVWDEEHKRAPVVFENSFNILGRDLDEEEATLAVELIIATQGRADIKDRLKEMLPYIRKNFARVGWLAARAIPFMDADFKSAIGAALAEAKPQLDAELSKNPFGVPIGMGTWAGSAQVAIFAVQMYLFHEAFPEIVGADYTLRGFDYVLGRHPATNLSFVSSVGTESKLIAYGNNRADFSFIPGGMVPGVLIVRPDFPEMKVAWPFLWYENEYVVDTVSAFILAANAADALTKEKP